MCRHNNYSPPFAEGELLEDHEIDGEEYHIGITDEIQVRDAEGYPSIAHVYEERAYPELAGIVRRLATRCPSLKQVEWYFETPGEKGWWPQWIWDVHRRTWLGRSLTSVEGKFVWGDHRYGWCKTFRVSVGEEARYWRNSL